MAIAFDSVVIDRVFDIFGEPCEVTNPVDGEAVQITVLDAVDGVMLGDFPVSSSKPAVCVRQWELSDLGFSSDELIDTNCVYKGQTYRIRDANSNPAPGLGRNALVNLIIVESSDA